MSDIDLDAIKARCEAATEGPWRWYNTETDEEVWHPGTDDDWHVSLRTTWTRESSVGPLPVFVLADVEYEADSPADAIFIAASRTDIPLLVAEVERLRAALQDRLS